MLLFFTKIRTILVVNNYLYVKSLIYMKTKKNTIRLTENDLKRVISESVKRVLRENYQPPVDETLEKCKALVYDCVKQLERDPASVWKSDWGRWDKWPQDQKDGWVNYDQWNAIHGLRIHLNDIIENLPQVEEDEDY